MTDTARARGEGKAVAVVAPKVKRMQPSPISIIAKNDFHLAAATIWSFHTATCNGALAYNTEQLVRMTEAALRRTWLDGHTHGVFAARDA